MVDQMLKSTEVNVDIVIFILILVALTYINILIFIDSAGLNRLHVKNILKLKIE